MRFGPTSLRLQSVLARGLRRPKLRPDLKISEQTIGQEKSYVIKVPETESYARYGPFEVELLRLCDGTRTAADIAAELTRRHPEQALSEEEVQEFLEEMDPNSWERSPGEKNLAVLEKIRDERKKKIDRANILYIYFSAWDPDRFLERIHPYLRWIFTKKFVGVCVLLFALTAVIIVADFSRIRQDTVEFYNFAQKSAYDLWIFWWILFFVSAVHEFGHGLTCKHYGGEVHQMGFMLMFFTPSFYTDCTDMCMFDRNAKRLWTIFAGIWIELVVCALATFVWFLAPPGSFVGDLGYKTLLLTGVSGVFINLNPLMKLDGYYALSQYLEIDNLREDSFAYLKAWFRRTLLRQDVDLPTVNRRKRRIFLLFGWAAFLYSALVLAIVAGFMKNVFTSKFGVAWGYALTAGVVYLLLRSRLRRWWPALKANLPAAKEKLMAWQMNRPQKAAVGALLVFVVAVPFSTKTTTDFVLEPGQRAQVRALVPGQVAEVSVREGEKVPAGAVLAVLRNSEVVARARRLEQELALAERALLGARAAGELGSSRRHARERQRLRAELAAARADRRALTLRTPIAGVVATPTIKQRQGDYLREGELFASVVNRTTLRARVLVRDWELEYVREGAKVELKVRAYPFRTFTGRVEQVLPAAATDKPLAAPAIPVRRGQELMNYFAVVLRFPNPEGLLREGMTGTAKIYGGRSPLAWQAGRSTWRWLRSHLW